MEENKADSKHVEGKLDEQLSFNAHGYDSVKDDEETTYTIDEAWEAIGAGKFQILSCVICGLAWAAESVEVLVLSILGPVLLCEWNLSTRQEALMTAVIMMGYLIGSLLFGYSADIYGRRRSLIWSCTVMLVFGLLTAASPKFTVLLLPLFRMAFNGHI